MKQIMEKEGKTTSTPFAKNSSPREFIPHATHYLHMPETTMVQETSKLIFQSNDPPPCSKYACPATSSYFKLTFTNSYKQSLPACHISNNEFLLL